eukprot:gb/GFBE01077842.1/.p1 GENE.gb/GFBE01077842.1/~~gb/GFBE01077842.1/.p1  ORF type:complete len:402 (+),score=54.84 gb/GFBE01077842.1/:1-1206(+)
MSGRRLLALLALSSQAAGDPSCAANPGCRGLPGDCCPTGGMMLACCGSSAAPEPLPAPPSKYVNHYNGTNPLGIRASNRRSENYFLIIGDWGRDSGPGQCQSAVAEKMKAYIRQQQAQGKQLLFVASAGDNFYWSGVKASAWEQSWSRPYGTNDPASPLYKIPWLAVLGNHDFGNDDPHAACPAAQGLAMASVEGQAYGSRQFNADKNPTRPEYTGHYWLPDYNYHYEIPEADLEVIAIDTNAHGIGELGGNEAGHRASFAACGGRWNVERFMNEVAEAGRDLLRQRARHGSAKTVLILQHYPGLCQRDIFEAELPAGRQVKVLCAYGHAHWQQCDGRDISGNCNMVLTGGGGGCCAPQVSHAGFAAVSLTDDGGFRTDVESDQVTLPYGTCAWRRLLQHG